MVWREQEDGPVTQEVESGISDFVLVDLLVMLSFLEPGSCHFRCASLVLCLASDFHGVWDCLELFRSCL